MDAQGRDLAETVWTRIDRKAGAVIELTIRQLRHKISTWVVLALGTMLMVLLLAFYIDSSGDISEFYHDGNEAVGYGTPFSTNINSSSSWQTATLTLPSFATKALTTFYSDGNGTGISKFFYRTYGSTSTWGHLVGKVEDDESEWNVSGFQVFTDYSGRIEIIDQIATSNYNVEIHSTGYFLPGGM